MTQKPQSFKCFASNRAAKAFGRDAYPGELQQQGQQGVIGAAIIDVGRALSSPISRNWREEFGVSLAKIVLVFGI